MGVKKLSHLDESGNARMVNVGDKPETRRTALASAEVTTRPDVIQQIRDNLIKKGDVLAVARIAGIMAAKKTSDLIPLCHPIPIDVINIRFEVKENTIFVISEVENSAKTGLEMEALTAVSVAALTIYDMCKAVDKSMVISNIRLLKKTGGKSGIYSRDE